MSHSTVSYCSSEKPGKSTEIERYLKKRNIREGRGRRESREVLDHTLLWDCSQEGVENRGSSWYVIGIDPVEQLKILTMVSNVYQNSEHKDGGRERVEKKDSSCEFHRRGSQRWAQKCRGEKLKGGKERWSRQQTNREQEGRREEKKRQVLIFLLRWFIYPPYGNTTHLGQTTQQDAQ